MKEFFELCVALLKAMGSMFDNYKYIKTLLLSDYRFSKELSAQPLFIISVNRTADLPPYRQSEPYTVNTIFGNYQRILFGVNPSAFPK